MKPKSFLAISFNKKKLATVKEDHGAVSIPSIANTSEDCSVLNCLDPEIMLFIEDYKDIIQKESDEQGIPAAITAALASKHNPSP